MALLLRTATLIRGLAPDVPLRAGDAIHLATAILSGVSTFLTGDRNLARCTEVSVEILC